MSKEMWIGIATAAGCWLGYMAWMTGYQAGFEEGVNTRFQQGQRITEQNLSVQAVHMTEEPSS